LLRAAEALDKAGIRYCLFCEPDKNHEFTAIATEQICGDERLFFNRFHLLNSSDEGTLSNKNPKKEAE